MVDIAKKKLVAGIAVGLLGLSVGSAGLAAADEPTPAPGPVTTVPITTSSSTDELTDMVMDALEQDGDNPATSAG